MRFKRLLSASGLSSALERLFSIFSSFIKPVRPVYSFALISLIIFLSIAFISCNSDPDLDNANSPNTQTDISNLTPIYFGSTYKDKIPKDSTKERYDEKLFAMIGGKVFDENLKPLSNVKITVFNQTEYGSALTDDNGFYVMPIEGGAKTTLRFSKDGYLTVDRSVNVNIQDWTLTADVRLIKQDSKSTLIDLKKQTAQIHNSSIVTDDRGFRSASIIFHGINSAKITSKTGTRTLNTITVRATEFQTPPSMPSELPAEMAFTYCIDITVGGVNDDEEISFEKPLSLLIDNFLNFPVGAIVPVGYYDRVKGEWIASDNGIIVKLLDTNSDGKIDTIDSGGKPLPSDTQSIIDAIKDNPTYKINNTYQLVSIDHFTPWDCNFPYGPPSDAVKPDISPLLNIDNGNKNGNNNDNVCAASYCKIKTQELHDDISITGTDIKLHYSSKSTNGYKYSIDTTADTTKAPSSIKDANAIFEIAGNRYEKQLQLNSINNISFEWDGKDALGNRLSGEIDGKLTIEYCYALVYYAGSGEFQQAWARAGTENLNIIGRDKVCIPNTQTISIFVENSQDDANEIADGWTIEDDLYLNVRSKGVLSNAVTHKYIEIKDNIYYAVDNKPQNLFSKPIIVPDAYYALYEIPSNLGYLTQWTLGWNNHQNTFIKIFYFDNRKAENISDLLLDQSVNLFEPEKSGILACSDGSGCYWYCQGNLYDEYAFYKNTGFGGLAQRYMDVSRTPWELKAKIRNRIDNNISYLSQLSTYQIPNGGYTCFSPGTRATPLQNNYWYNYYPLESLYEKLDNLYPDSYRNENNDYISSILPSAPKDSIIVFNGNLGYIYDFLTANLAAIFDNPSKRIIRKYSYDKNYKLTAIEDQFGNTIKIARDTNGKATQITAPNGQITKLTQNNNNLSSIIYEDNSKYSFGYNSDSLLINKITPNGNTIKYTYNSLGRVTNINDADGYDWKFAKSTNADNQTEYKVTNPDGYSTIYKDRTNGDGSLYSTIVLPNSDSYIYQSNANGTETNTTTDGTIVKTLTTRDYLTLETILSKRETITPSGIKQITTQSVSYEGNITDPKSKTTRIASSYYAPSYSSSYYNQTITVKNSYTDNRVTITSPTANIKQTLDYNKQTGLITKYQYADFAPTTYEYDNKGRLTKQQFLNNKTTYTHDNRGNIASITDANNQTTTFTYDLLGRITKATYPNKSFDTYQYDNQGNITKYRTPGNKEYSFAYNGLDFRTLFKLPSNKTTLYEYTGDRKPKSIRYSNGKQANYSYDSGQLKQLTTNEAVYAYNYSFYNKLSSIETNDEKTSYSYDGHLLTKIEYNGLVNETIDITYANGGYVYGLNPASITYGGVTNSYQYDQDGQPVIIAGASIHYYTNGLPYSIYSENYSKTYSYDQGGLIYGYFSYLLYSAGFNETINDRYPDLKIKKRTESISSKQPADIFNYEYDSIGQLTKVTKNDQIVEQYEYDLNGNRTKSIINNITKTAAYNQDDELLTYGNESYEYDQSGFLKSKTIDKGTPNEKKTTYVYGTLGELKEVILPDHTKITYKYNANNQRISKEINGTIYQKYLWLNNTTLLGFYDKDNNFARFTYAIDRTPLRMDYKGVTHYLIYDRLGSLRAVSGSNGQGFIKQIDYDSFGNIIRDDNYDANGKLTDSPILDIDIPLGFAGGLYDRDTNLTRFGYRDYDPNTGRWTAKDPIDFNGEQSNLYVYVGNDPVNYYDEEGLEHNATAAEEIARRLAILHRITGGAKNGIDIGLGVYEFGLGVKQMCYDVEHPPTYVPIPTASQETQKTLDFLRERDRRFGALGVPLDFNKKDKNKDAPKPPQP